MFTRSTLAVFLLFIGQFAFAGAEIFTLKSYEEVVKVFEDEASDYSPSELLFVFDLDRTVLHSTECLSDSDTTKGFFRFEKTVQLCGATLTSPKLPGIIQDLQTRGYGVMALTARRAKGIDLVSPKGDEKLKFPMLEGTLRQLEELTVSETDETHAPVFFTTAPLYSSRVKTIKFDQQGKKKVLKKELVVKKGVAMASGANKGLAIQAFVKRMKKADRPQQIIFVDDDMKNIRNLEKAYKDSEDSIVIIHYTEFEKKKKAKAKKKD